LVVLPTDKYPRLRASYDMAWEQRNSSNKYDSTSGHVLYMGAVTHMPLSLVIKSKLCNYCSAWEKKNTKDKEDAGPPPPHTCRKNHNGSMGSLEAVACLEMTVDLYNNKKCLMSVVCILTMMPVQSQC
jgi:hypothetical protein